MNDTPANGASTAAASDTSAAAPAPGVSQLNFTDSLAQLKIFVGALVNQNLELAISLLHLAQVDLENNYVQQIRFAELRRAQEAQLAKQQIEKDIAAQVASGAAPAVPGDAQAAANDSTASSIPAADSSSDTSN